MANMGKERRMERMNAYVNANAIVSDRTYNLIMGGTVLYGIAVNIILCNLVGNVYMYVNPIMFMLAYFVLCFAGIFIANKSQNPAVSFLGYNMVVVPFGLVISTLVEAYGGISSSLVTDAFYFTALITAIMVFASLAFPSVFDRMGGFLFVSLIALLICGIFAMFMPGMYTIYSYAAAAIFSLYIGYDFHRSQMFPRTVDNAIDCALDIYIDIANLFVRLLQIFGRSND